MNTRGKKTTGSRNANNRNSSMGGHASSSLSMNPNDRSPFTNSSSASLERLGNNRRHTSTSNSSRPGGIGRGDSKSSASPHTSDNSSPNNIRPVDKAGFKSTPRNHHHQQHHPSHNSQGSQQSHSHSQSHRQQQRSSSPNNNDQNNDDQAKGIYSNERIMFAMTSLLGSVVKVVHKEGYTLEGVFKAFSPELDISLVEAIEIDPASPSEGFNIGHLISSLPDNSVHKMMVMGLKDIVAISAMNVDLEYASRSSFVTDSELSASKTNRSGSGGNSSNFEKALVPWNDDDDSADASGGLNGPSASGSSNDLSNRCTFGAEANENGWTAEDMFEKNSQLGVQTGYTDLDGTYTIPLNRGDDDEYRRKEEEASRIADSIEKSSISKQNAEKELNDGRTEEDRYSAVTRRNVNPVNVHNSNNNSSSGSNLPSAHGSRENSHPPRSGGPRGSNVSSKDSSSDARDTDKDINDSRVEEDRYSTVTRRNLNPINVHTSNNSNLHSMHGARDNFHSQRGGQRGGNSQPKNLGSESLDWRSAARPGFPSKVTRKTPQQIHSGQSQNQQASASPSTPSPAQSQQPSTPQQQTPQQQQQQQQHQTPQQQTPQHATPTGAQASSQQQHLPTTPVQSQNPQQPQQQQQQQQQSSLVQQAQPTPPAHQARDAPSTSVAPANSGGSSNPNSAASNEVVIKSEEKISKDVSDGSEKRENDSPNIKKSDLDSKTESLVKNSSLNPNAKEFKLNPSAKEFTPRLPSAMTIQQQSIAAISNVTAAYSPSIVNAAAAQMNAAHHAAQAHQANMVATSIAHMQNAATLSGQAAGSGHHQFLPVHPHHHQRMPSHAHHGPVPLLPQMVGPGIPVMGSSYFHPHSVIVSHPSYGQMTQGPPQGNAMNNSGNSGGSGMRQNKNNSKYSNSSGGGGGGSGRPGPGQNNNNEQYTNHQNSSQVVAATGPPVLAAASIPYQQPGVAGGGPMFHQVYSLSGFNPRMPIMSPHMTYDPSLYMSGMPVSMVAPLAQQANGPHSNPSTPQSQTPNNPGMHGGPPTPGPAGHLVAVNQPSAPQTPQPTSVIFPGSNMPAHSVAGPFNAGQAMVLMQGHHAAVGANNPGNTGHPGHVVPVMSANAPTALVTTMPPHFQPQQQQPSGRPPQQPQQSSG